MTIGKHLASVESIFMDQSISSVSSYWFSYRNSQGDIMNAFRNKIVLVWHNGGESIEIDYGNIENIDLIAPNVTDVQSCGVFIKSNNIDIFFPVDTLSKSKFFDVFPIHKALDRQLVIERG
jgi:hypothetical protein